jgi:hypothetical protein
MNREAIYSALFNLVLTAPGLITTSRKLLHWDDVQLSAMPALFQAQGAQTALAHTGMPTRWEMTATLWIYVSTMDAGNPGSIINPIVDAIAAALDLDAFAKPQTLGGLVAYARIEGTAETSEGTLGDREVIKIPVRMLTA